MDPFADSQPDPLRGDGDDVMEVVDDEEDEEDDEDPPRTIPPELLTRILHMSFEKEGTRISKDANKAVAQYMDIFVRESIARVALEKEAGFLEVRLLAVDGLSLCFFPPFNPSLPPVEAPFTFSSVYPFWEDRQPNSGQKLTSTNRSRI